MELELTGTYPIILSGTESGELSVTRDGLYWVFDAKCDPQPELVRLSVFGESGEGYLGVMEPCGDRLVLTKRLSRAALSGFPSTITHAGKCGEASSSSETVSSPAADSPEIECDNFPPDETKPPSKESCIPPALNWLPCPCPCSLFTGLPEKSAFGAVRGARFAEYDGYYYLAVPMEEAAALPYGLIPFLYQTKISNETFFICLIKNGKAMRSLA